VTCTGTVANWSAWLADLAAELADPGRAVDLLDAAHGIADASVHAVTWNGRLPLRSRDLWHRVLVFRHGRITAEIGAEVLSEEASP
jgi:hypothetical protein